VKNNNIDRIVFKYDPKDGTVIAFLPDEAAPPGLIATYAHVGQSSYASWDYYQSCKTLDNLIRIAYYNNTYSKL